MDTYDNIYDREGWPPGPWDNEPDRAEWVHDETGARCTMRRGPLGAWCGYCGVGENHPAFLADYDDVNVYVHGGLTFGKKCKPILDDEWIRYRSRRDQWVMQALLYPHGDAARDLREDRKGDTSTLKGYQEWMERRVICHPDCRHGLRWFGFDCGHIDDIVPGILAVRLMMERERGIPYHLPGSRRDRETYREFSYVFEETNKLAVELFKVKVTKERG